MITRYGRKINMKDITRLTFPSHWMAPSCCLMIPSPAAKPRDSFIRLSLLLQPRAEGQHAAGPMRRKLQRKKHHCQWPLIHWKY
jgi:hypothetical protein